MHKKNGTKLVAAIFVTFLLAGLIKLALQQIPSDENTRFTNVLTAYNDWKAEYERRGGDRNLVLALGWSRGLSAEFTTAKGQATFDLVDKKVSVEVQGLPEGSVSDVWLVDNQPWSEQSAMPEAGDTKICIGQIRTESGFGRLQADLDQGTFANFKLDLVVISRADQGPEEGGVLFGMPSLFQRLYRSLQNDQAGIPVYPGSLQTVVQAGVGFDLLEDAKKDAGASVPLYLRRLIQEGEHIFFNETYEGNGRTCGTCHRLENNFTIDPEFIATLPNDDPLFVAEYTPALNSELNGGLVFENPVLMRQAGLIVENLDGFDDLSHKYVMRGVPHNLAMKFTLKPSSEDSTTQPPYQRTGWSGDGAPGGGTLRDFAIGAVTQHFSKTLNRTPGVDFRLPTEHELDALEAYQLSIGRQEELDLNSMRFKDANITAGQALFMGDAKCNMCHFNGGANFMDTDENRNFNTGVEDFPSPFDSLGQPLPRDGGFGRTPNGDGRGGYGNGTFNPPPLVEAGDTPPHFHNNITDDLDASIAFYNSDEFNNSPGGQFVGGIDMSDTDLFQVTAFVYALNVLENIRVVNNLLFTAILTFNQEKANKTLELAGAEADDAVESMEDTKVQPEVVDILEQAEVHIENAQAARIGIVRIIEISRALANLKQARFSVIDNDHSPVLSKQIAKTAGQEPLPSSYQLFQNYPNPFNPETEIRFQLPEANDVMIKIFNARGQEIRTLVDTRYNAGEHTVRWDSRDNNGTPVASGLYLYRIQAGTFSEVMKMSLLR